MQDDLRAMMAELRVRVANLETAFLDHKREIREDIRQFREALQQLQRSDATTQGKNALVAVLWHMLTAVVSAFLTWLGLSSKTGGA